jgi:hypothetical protein
MMSDSQPPTGKDPAAPQEPAPTAAAADCAAHDQHGEAPAAGQVAHDQHGEGLVAVAGTGMPSQRRRVRRSRQVEVSDGGPETAEPPAEHPAPEAPDSAEPAAPTPAAAPRARPARPRRLARGRAAGGPPRPDRPAAKGAALDRSRRGEPPPRPVPDRATPGAVGAIPRRHVYRQDAPGRPAAAPAAPPAPAPKPATPLPAASKGPASTSDKITLILHPAPKASGSRKTKAADKPKTAKEALKAKAARRGPDRSGGEGEAPSPAHRAIDAQWLTATGDTARAALDAAGEAAEGLVKAWLDAANTAALGSVAALATAPGKLRKAARRALNVLRARGVAVPEAEPKPAPRSVEPPEPPSASFIPPDSSGTAFYSISQRLPGGRYRVADVMVRDSTGIVHASSGQIPGKRIREWKNRIREHFGTVPIEVPLEWARHRIAEGRKRNDESRQLLPLGWDGCIPLVAPAPEHEPAHPVADLEAGPPSAEEVDAARAASAQLHEAPEFRGWLPDRSALDELIAKVGERLTATGTAEDRGAIDLALADEVAAATDRFFTPEMRARLAARMRDAAISLRTRLGDAAARSVLAVAAAIRQAGLITSPPRDIPFLQVFFRKGIALLAQQSQGQLRVPVGRQPSP